MGIIVHRRPQQRQPEDAHEQPSAARRLEALVGPKAATASS
ncbi:hypothetical protein [Pseudomonas gregormendelii]